MWNAPLQDRPFFVNLSRVEIASLHHPLEACDLPLTWSQNECHSPANAKT